MVPGRKVPGGITLSIVKIRCAVGRPARHSAHLPKNEVEHAVRRSRRRQFQPSAVRKVDLSGFDFPCDVRGILGEA